MYENEGEALVAASDSATVFAEADEQNYREELRKAETEVTTAKQAKRQAGREEAAAFFRGRTAYKQAKNNHRAAKAALTAAENALVSKEAERVYRGHEVEWNSRIFKLNGKFGFSTPLPGEPGRRSAGGVSRQKSMPPWDILGYAG